MTAGVFFEDPPILGGFYLDLEPAIKDLVSLLDAGPFERRKQRDGDRLGVTRAEGPPNLLKDIHAGSAGQFVGLG